MSFFQRTLMHTEIAWQFRVYDLFPIVPYLCLPKASAQALLQRMVLEWSWSQATGVVLVARGSWWQVTLVTWPASSWNSECDEDYMYYYDYYVLSMIYVCTVQILGRHNDAKFYWKLSEMCSQCMNSTGSRSVRLWISFLQPRAQQVGGTGNEGKGQILSIFPPCLCTGNMQNMAQICSKSHVSPGKPWKKGNFDRLLLEWCHLTSL